MRANDSFGVGDRIRAYHFEPCEGRPESYLVGVVLQVVDEPYRAYRVAVERDVMHGEDMPGTPARESLVPLRVSPRDFDGRVSAARTESEGAGMGDLTVHVVAVERDGRFDADWFLEESGASKVFATRAVRLSREGAEGVTVHRYAHRVRGPHSGRAIQREVEIDAYADTRGSRTKAVIGQVCPECGGQVVFHDGRRPFAAPVGDGTCEDPVMVGPHGVSCPKCGWADADHSDA